MAHVDAFGYFIPTNIALGLVVGMAGHRDPVPAAPDRNQAVSATQ